ncbi:Unknown protein, partial [Striga hermonthica]
TKPWSSFSTRPLARGPGKEEVEQKSRTSPCAKEVQSTRSPTEAAQYVCGPSQEKKKSGGLCGCPRLSPRGLIAPSAVSPRQTDQARAHLLAWHRCSRVAQCRCARPRCTPSSPAR